MKILLSVILLFWVNNLLAQNNKVMKFIYIGKTVKPKGPLIISVNDITNSSVNAPDSIFGHFVKTDLRSFDLVEEFINNYEFMNADFSEKEQFTFGIINSKKRIIYLAKQHREEFINALENLISKFCLDKNILEPFGYY